MDLNVPVHPLDEDSPAKTASGSSSSPTGLMPSWACKEVIC